MERVFHNAKIGDIVYSLPAIYRRGGVKEYHIQREHAAEYLRPLLESQPYIGAVIHSKNCPDKAAQAWTDCKKIGQHRTCLIRLDRIGQDKIRDD